MSIPLIRLEDAKNSRAFFETKPSPWGNAFIIIVCFILAGAFLWASLMQMDDVIKAQATLRPQDAISELKSPVTAQITRKHYVQGQYVQLGDVLWETDSESSRIDLANARTQYGRVLRQLSDNETVAATLRQNRNMSAEPSSEAWSSSEYFLAEQARLQVALDKAGFELSNARNLPPAMVTPQQILGLEMDVESCKLALSSFRTNEQLKIQLDRNRLLDEKGSLEGRMSELEQQLRFAAMRAPISGRIDETDRINVGDYILAGQEIVKIVPQSVSALKADLVVAPGDIARIQTGMKVTLRFTALPPSEFGDIEGTITLLPADVSLGVGNVPCFVVESDLDRTYLTNHNGERIFLHVGMTADARIIIRHESVLRMVLRKLDFIK